MWDEGSAWGMMAAGLAMGGLLCTKSKRWYFEVTRAEDVPRIESELLDQIAEQLHLEYRYDEEVTTEEVRAAARSAGAFPAGTLNAVSRATLQAMCEAATKGDIDRLSELIEQIEPAAGAAVSELCAFADRYDYDGNFRVLGEGGASEPQDGKGVNERVSPGRVAP